MTNPKNLVDLLTNWLDCYDHPDALVQYFGKTHQCQLMLVEGLPRCGKSSVVSYLDTIITKSTDEFELVSYKSGSHLMKEYAITPGGVQWAGMDKATVNVLEFLTQTGVGNDSKYRFLFDRSYLTVMAYMGGCINLYGNVDMANIFLRYCNSLGTCIVYVHSAVDDIMKRGGGSMIFSRSDIEYLHTSYMKSIEFLQTIIHGTEELNKVHIVCLDNTKENPEWLSTS